MTTLRARSEDPMHHGASCRGTDNTSVRTFTYTISVTEDWLRNCVEYAWVRSEAGLAFREWCDAQREALR